MPDAADATTAAGLRLEASTTLRDALSQLLTAGERQCLVVDAEGNALGVLTIDHLSALLSAREPEAVS